MKLSIIILILVCVIGHSCTRESIGSTHTKATLTNKTLHNIKVLFYKGGIVYPNDTIKLSANESFLFADSYLKGEIILPAFSSKYFGNPSDSIVVIFDNIYKISHYADTPLQKASKYYLNSSLRNIANPNSFIFQSTQQGNNSRLNDHYYEFKEQDYLDAQ